MQDTNLMLRAAASLTATATGSAVDFGAGGAKQAITFKVIVPQAAGTSPTLDVEIHESDTTAFTVVRRTHTLAQITAAGVHRVSIRPKYRYLRYKATVAGTSPDFGSVSIGPEAQGEYDQF